MARIAGFGKLSFDQFRSQLDSQDIILFRMEKVLQECLDLACHLAADENWGVPDRYRDAFTLLGSHGVTEPDLTSFLEDAAGFRNILVHGYEKMNLERAFDIYSQRSRFDDFCDAILRRYPANP